MTKFNCLVLILSFFCNMYLWAHKDSYAAISILSEGRWVKIKVSETGIYKLTAADLKEMGFADPSKVGVYGYGGWMLNEDFSQNDYIDDLPEVATWKGDGDFILFYAKGPIRWKLNGSHFVHERNPYSDAGYYFLCENAEPKRMEIKQNKAEASKRTTSFDDYFLHEKELFSVNNSGRELFGESFTTNKSQDFTFSVPGITDDDGKISFRFISKAANSEGKLVYTINGDVFSQKTFQINNGEYVAAVEATETGKSWVGQKSETIKTNITYTGASSHKNIHLDYITLQVKRELQPYGDVTLFRDINSNLNISRFIIKDATKDMLVFDVTDGENLKQIETSFAENELSFIVSPEQLPKNATVQEFALVQPNGTIPSPEIVGEIKTQNLHALEQADMIIIAPESFTVQAERLAKAHREKDSLSVHVVDPQTIYNEFSSGTPDATAYRRFMKMFYDRSTSETDTPKYLLLFGDGAFDNRQLTTDWKMVNMNNFLLTFQSENSIDAGTSNNIKSFVTDDYFGFLEDREGGNIKEADVDIGIGRFPVRTVTQAKNAVDKVISYMNNAEFGSWKNTVCFLADDGNQADNYTTLHMFQADQLAEQILKNNPEYIAKKLFFDAHKKDNSSSGFATYPTIRTNLIQQLKEGTFLLNYTGHGSKDSWSDEKVLVQSDINQFSYKQLPLWITATCDFTPFDALLTSAGEDVFLNAKSGGIALFTTMRIAYPSSNLSINSTLLKYLFKRTNENYPTLGEVFKQTKRDLGNLDQRLNFILIGDPALRLNYPQSEIRITEINGQPVSDVNVNFSALEKVTIKGMILNPNESKNESFNGEINPTVFDSQTSITTLNNNNTGVTFEFNDFSNKLFIGNEKVTSGEFEFSFTVPKDISYSNKIGKMSFYASDPTTGNEAKGSFLNYTVGGTGGEIEDVEGPQIIALYLNDSTFTEGGQVNKTPLLVVQLWDTTGVNITGSSIGHDITLVIDGQSSQTYNLNAYYKKISDAEGEGIIYFSIPELTSGFHSAELKVWDILNNSTTTTFTFEVIEGLKPKLYELLAAPSPARESVTFYLYHNRPESTVKMSVQVYDMMGRLQWKGETQGSSGIDLPLTIQWNLQNGYGSRLRPGIYIYRAGISADNSKEVTDAKKLIILAQ